MAESYKSIIIVADANTYAVCGAVKKQIDDKLEYAQIFEWEGSLVPDENAICTLEGVVTDKTVRMEYQLFRIDHIYKKL